MRGAIQPYGLDADVPTVRRNVPSEADSRWAKMRGVEKRERGGGVGWKGKDTTN